MGFGPIPRSAIAAYADEFDIADPIPQSDAAADPSATLEAPRLFNPNDRTAAHHEAPIWTAVYHKPVENTTHKAQSVSQQTSDEGDGWVSALK